MTIEKTLLRPRSRAPAGGSSGLRPLFWLPLLFLLPICGGAAARAAVLLQGFYWNVPSPAAGNPDAAWWWDHLARQASDLSRAGFTAVWLPPVVKGASGGYSVGYDPFDDYDIGAKLQRGTLPTRYGSREQLERLISVLRANGLAAYVDLVENHRDGDPGNWRFQYRDAQGEASGGRFPKGPLDFHPNVPQDPGVPLDGREDFFQFGRDLAPVNSPGGRTGTELNAAGDWLTRSLGIQGYRLDDVKGISTVWLPKFLDSGAMRGKFAVGEFYDYNLKLVESWVQQGMHGRARAFDFPLRGLLKQMCDPTASFDMGKLVHSGLAGIDRAHAVTFVENHDTDRSDPIVHGKMLAYAYILTSPGTPCVFYRDYSRDPGCYGLEDRLKPLLRIHEMLAAGGMAVRRQDRDALAYERLGDHERPHLLVALSRDPAKAHVVTIRTAFGPRVLLHDFVQHAPNLRTDGAGRLTLAIPPNEDGAGYVCYAPATASERLKSRAFPVTQVYEGAADLDIRPASADPVTVCRIWPISGLQLTGSVRCSTDRWSRTTRLVLQALAENGRVLFSRTFDRAIRQGRTFRFRAPAAGSCAFTLRLLAPPHADFASPFLLRLTYRGQFPPAARPTQAKVVTRPGL